MSLKTALFAALLIAPTTAFAHVQDSQFTFAAEETVGPFATEDSFLPLAAPDVVPVSRSGLNMHLSTPLLAGSRFLPGSHVHFAGVVCASKFQVQQITASIYTNGTYRGASRARNREAGIEHQRMIGTCVDDPGTDYVVQSSQSVTYGEVTVTYYLAWPAAGENAPTLTGYDPTETSRFVCLLPD